MTAKQAPASTKRLQIEKSKTRVLVAVIVASIVVSFSLVATKFLWDLGRHYAQLAGKKEETRDTLNHNLATAPQLEEQFTVFENPDDGITSQIVLDALPSKYDFPALVTSLDALAKRSGMTVTSVSGEDLGDAAENTSTAPTPIVMPITLTIQGQYSDLEKFLNNLDLSIRPFSVTSIEIRGSDRLITAEMTVETHYQPAINLEVVEVPLEQTNSDGGGSQ